MIWYLNSDSNKDLYGKYLANGTCLYQEWLIKFAKSKWEPDFVDFDFSIQKIKDSDNNFIDFDSIYSLNIRAILRIKK